MSKGVNDSEHKVWCSSKETKKALKISDCELMHIRLAGKLEFKKVGNSYFYHLDKSKVIIDGSS